MDTETTEKQEKGIEPAAATAPATAAARGVRPGINVTADHKRGIVTIQVGEDQEFGLVPPMARDLARVLRQAANVLDPQKRRTKPPRARGSRR